MESIHYNFLLPETPGTICFRCEGVYTSTDPGFFFITTVAVYIIGVTAWTGPSVWFSDARTSAPGCCRNVWGRFHPPSGSVAWATHSAKVAR